MRFPWSDAERQLYESRYPQESTAMTGLVERLQTESMQKGRQEGRQEGRHEGVEGMLRKQIELKFGELPAWVDERLKQASDEQLDTWVARILTADSLDALFTER
jgi:predicted transposase YdaD